EQAALAIGVVAIPAEEPEMPIRIRPGARRLARARQVGARGRALRAVLPGLIDRADTVNPAPASTRSAGIALDQHRVDATADGAGRADRLPGDGHTVIGAIDQRRREAKGAVTGNPQVVAPIVLQYQSAGQAADGSTDAEGALTRQMIDTAPTAASHRGTEQHHARPGVPDSTRGLPGSTGGPGSGDGTGGCRHHKVSSAARSLTKPAAHNDPQL